MEMILPTNEADEIAELLTRARNIAVVGLSSSPLRPSHGVSAYMQTHGYHIIPVNPEISEALGEKAYASLRTFPRRSTSLTYFAVLNTWTKSLMQQLP